MHLAASAGRQPVLKRRPDEAKTKPSFTKKKGCVNIGAFELRQMRSNGKTTEDYKGDCKMIAGRLPEDCGKTTV